MIAKKRVKEQETFRYKLVREKKGLQNYLISELETRTKINLYVRERYTHTLFLCEFGTKIKIFLFFNYEFKTRARR